MIEVAQAEELRKALNEHLEITRNATARTYATLSYDEAARLLEQAEEEKEADKTFSGLAEKLHVEALEAGNNSAGRGEEAQPKRPAKRPSKERNVARGQRVTSSGKAGGLSVALFARFSPLDHQIQRTPYRRGNLCLVA